MTFGKPFKEVYIHLVENEQALVCTVRYGGVFGKPKQFPLEIGPEVAPDLHDESLAVVRTRNRYNANPQRER